MPAMERCLPSEQVPFDGSPSGQGPLAQERFTEEPSAQRTSGQTPSAQTLSALKPLKQVAAGKGRDEETRVPSAQVPSVVAVRAGVAGPPGASSPTHLEVLVGHGVEAAGEEAARPARQNRLDSPRQNRRGFLRRQRSLRPKTTCLRRRRKWSRCENRILAKELVHQTQALEKSEAARKADEELLGRMQAQCDELRGYARWEIATQERMTLREMGIRAAALMSGESRSRRRVAKRLESFLSRSRDAIATLEAKVTGMLRRLGLRRIEDEWTGRELVSSRPSHRRHSR
ncbi:hypothetical protein AXG93_3932s1000 [Marchantia polymorpha subsp. ruderalis]|uniref:Uncharacterized protein n=1 Tax=Marchantia polymorpha subsp. ruderalis TaxID=1480154 RepID=A0A176VKT3_MARPO|nr:hypothetical protein AXG93_3932s1000 [Marchantia polymorpha subsp. ruderalis]